jgi:hypothetical protein
MPVALVLNNGPLGNKRLTGYAGFTGSNRATSYAAMQRYALSTPSGQRSGLLTEWQDGPNLMPA